MLEICVWSNLILGVDFSEVVGKHNIVCLFCFIYHSFLPLKPFLNVKVYINYKDEINNGLFPQDQRMFLASGE